MLRNQTARGQRQQQAGATNLGQFHAASYLCRRSQILWRRIHAARRQSNLVFGLNKNVAFHRHARQVPIVDESGARVCEPRRLDALFDTRYN